MRLPSPLATTLLIVGACVAYLQIRSYLYSHPLDEDAAAPAFALLDLAAPHDTVRLADYRGQVLILEAWARSCENCKYSMPRLDSLAGTYAERGVQVLHIALEEMADSASMRQFLKDYAGSGTRGAVDDNRAFQASYSVTGLPTGYLVDRRGRLRWQGYSAADELSRASGRRLMEAMLAEQ